MSALTPALGHTILVVQVQGCIKCNYIVSLHFKIRMKCS